MSSLSATPFNAPFAIDRDEVSITIEWAKIPSALSYHIQMKDGEFDDWIDLSKNLKGNKVKKGNLSPTSSYTFRVRGRDAIDFFEFSPSSLSVTVEIPTSDSSPSIISPTPSQKETSLVAGTIAVCWDAIENASKYEVYMRVEGEGDFVLLGAVSSCEVRKKNLDTKKSYYFKTNVFLKPGDERAVQHSRSSLGIKPALVMTQFVNNLFRGLEGGKMLVDKTKNNTLATMSLGSVLTPDKLVLLYFSASWCGPCRQFTPKLSSFYNSFHTSGNFEIIFVSCDHDEPSFNKYYLEHMPFFACPYEEGDVRERLLSEFKVSGVPCLKVLSSSGVVIEDNAANYRSFDEDTAKQWWLKAEKK